MGYRMDVRSTYIHIICMCMNIYMYIYNHTYIHPHTHIYIYTYVYFKIHDDDGVWLKKLQHVGYKIYSLCRFT
jgi:hypothetical protein